MLMLTVAANGCKLAKAVPLIMGDNVEKADIEICKDPSGEGDWLLGKGASGRVLLVQPPICFSLMALVLYICASSPL